MTERLTLADPNMFTAQMSGTTVTFVIVDGLIVTIASVGDSRYILESADGSIYHLSADHRLDTNEEVREPVAACGGEVGRLNTGVATTKIVDEESIKVAMCYFLNDLHEVIPLFGARMNNLKRSLHVLPILKSPCWVTIARSRNVVSVTKQLDLAQAANAEIEAELK